jgi:hypothetical protein
LAAGSTEPRRQSLGVLEHVVRDRNGCFHTSSITAQRSRVNARGTAKIKGSRPSGQPSPTAMPASPLHCVVQVSRSAAGRFQPSHCSRITLAFQT